MFEQLLSNRVIIIPTVIPGPSELKAGDLQKGWYGETPVEDLINGTDLATMLGLNIGVVQNTNSPWLKMAYKNKTLFIAKNTYRHTVSWNNIQDVNAVYGDRILNIGGIDYRIRLIIGSMPENDNSTEGSEWNELIYPLAKDNPGTPVWESYNDVSLSYGGGRGVATLTQTTPSTNPDMRVVRGNNGLVRYNEYGPTESYAPFGWRPVLEMV